MNVKTSELTGAALDWFTGVACGYIMALRPRTGQASSPLKAWRKSAYGGFTLFDVSANWVHGGPLVDKFNVDFNTQGVDLEDGSQLIEATVQDFEAMQCWTVEGDTRLQAMCRAIVLSKLGDEVDVPAELLATGEHICSR